MSGLSLDQGQLVNWDWNNCSPGGELQGVRSGLGLFLMQAGVSLGLYEVKVWGRCAMSGEMRTGLCGCVGRPGAGTGLEGSRPAASGTNANENWADLSKGDLRP